MSLLRPLGTSGLSIAPLMLGGNVFGWTADRAASFEVLDAFVAGGGTMIDTADSYSNWLPGHVGGESETIIGEWLKAGGKRDQVLIATKVGLRKGERTGDLKPARIAEQVEASLRRLGTDRIDLYFAHRDDFETPIADYLGAFDALVRAGKVRAIGASNFGAERLLEALDISRRGGLAAFSVVEPLYSLVERGFEADLRPACAQHGLGVVPYYVLASGFLTGKYRTQADLGQSVRGGSAAAYLNGAGPAVLAVMDAIAGETGATLAQIALAWAMAQPTITAPIASATSVAQVEDLLGAMHLTLSAEQLARLDVVSRQ